MFHPATIARILALLGLGALSACGSSTQAPSHTPDCCTPDFGPENDASADLSSSPDLAAPDAAADVGPDLGPDLAPDLARDATPDAAAQPEPDAQPSPADAPTDMGIDAQRAAQLVISPLQVELEGTVGQTGPTVMLVVANAGDVATSALTVVIEGANAQDFKVATNGCLAPLAGLSSCQVGVAFQPQTAGMKAAVLKVSSPLGGMATATLTGTAQFPSTLTITPGSATFGPTAVGSTTPATTFQVKNTGATATAALTANTSSAEFTITANACGGASLPPSGTCNVSVAFSPASPGTKNGSLTVMGGANEIFIAPLHGSTP